MTEERVKRRLAAVLATDMVGYSRLMGADETTTLATLKKHRAEVLEPAVAAHDGRIVKLMGDGVLAEFASVVDAVQCAVLFQGETTARNTDIPDDRRIEFRIGINLGDVILDGDDIYGDGVNVAARLESLAEPGGICISGAVHYAVGNKLAVRAKFMGEKEVKNIATPVRAYRIAAHGATSATSSRSLTSRGTGPAVTGAKRRDGPSLAIRPFDNLSGDPEQDHVADFLTHGLITALIRVPRLSLIGDESPNLEKSRQMTAEGLGRAFDVQFVVSGSIQKLGARLRVSVTLMDVSVGRYIWAENFDRDLSDPSELFAIQDEITAEIVIALDVKLLSGEAGRIVRKVFTNPKALEVYYQAERIFWNPKTALELREAQRLFKESISLEPTVSVGYAVVALAYWAEASSGVGDASERAQAQAMEFARQAIELGDVTGYPHLILAHVHLIRREYDQAVAEADRAVSTRPSCPGAYSLKANVLNYLGRPQEAIDFAEYAVRLTPVHPPDYPAVLANAYYGCDLYEDAIAAAMASLDLDDGNLESRLVMAAAQEALGHHEEAQTAAESVRKLKPDFSLASFEQSQPYKEQAHLNRLITRLRQSGLD